MDSASSSFGAEAAGDELLVAPLSPTDCVSKTGELLGVSKMGELAGSDAMRELAEVGERGGVLDVLESGELTGVSERGDLLAVLESVELVGAAGIPVASAETTRGSGRTVLLPEATVCSPVAIEESRAPGASGSSKVPSI